MTSTATGALPAANSALGWPWDALAEVVEIRRDAERFAEAALECGTDNDRRIARFELEAALEREGAVRDDLAAIFLLMLQSAIDKQPEALFGKLMAAADDVQWREVVAWLVNTKPGGAEQWLELSRRCAAAEEAAKKARTECWELANWIARLERELESMKAGAAHGDRGPGQGPTTPEQRSTGGERREAG